MALTALVQADALPPRVKLTTDGTAVTRTDESGASVLVRGDVTGGVIYDYEAPQGVALTYTADTGGTARVGMPDVGNWLVHLSQPGMSCRLELETEDGVALPARVSTLRTFSGRPYSVAAGSRGWLSSALSLHTITREDTRRMLALLDDQSILFFSPHPGHDDEGARYVRVLDVDKRRFMDWCESPRRVFSLPYLVQDRPSTVVADAYGWDLMPTLWSGMPTSWAGMP